jgi:DNA-binding NtrC family response regulator
MAQRVLIVDDDKVIGKSLKKLLTIKGLEAEYVEEPQKAFLSLDRKEFDIVLIDLNMPALNGIDLANLIMKKYPLISTIIMTGGGCVDDYMRAQSLGIKDFIHKPFELDMFMKMIKEMELNVFESDQFDFKSLN